jgi:predicted XRE-type DNA-binding protein
MDKQQTRDAAETSFERSSGNVFADLGIPDAETHLAKADLAHEIRVAIRERGLTQTEAARRLGTSQARVSEILSGRVQGMTYDRLIGFLDRLGRDVVFTVIVRHNPSDRPAVASVAK